MTEPLPDMRCVRKKKKLPFSFFVLSPPVEETSFSVLKVAVKIARIVLWAQWVLNHSNYKCCHYSYYHGSVVYFFELKGVYLPYVSNSIKHTGWHIWAFSVCFCDWILLHTLKKCLWFFLDVLPAKMYSKCLKDIVSSLFSKPQTQMV